MNRLPETPRFPCLNAFMAVLASLIPSLAISYFAYKCLLPAETAASSLTRIWQLIRPALASLVIIIVGEIVFTNLIIFLINHLTGREHFSDRAPAISMFAEAYTISNSYVLPYAYNFTNNRDEYFCELYLSFSYAEILHVYQTLRKRHQLAYQFRTLSLPNHLGRRMPLLTRAGAEQILRDMSGSANATGEDVQKQRVVLLYTFWPSCSCRINLPDRQTFISRNVIRDLLSLIDPDPDHIIPDDAEVNVFYDAGRIITLSAGYLNTNYARIATEDELIYLPISPA